MIVSTGVDLTEAQRERVCTYIVALIQLSSVSCQRYALLHVANLEGNSTYASPVPTFSKHLHASILPARHIVRTITRSREVGRAVLVPGELLGTDSPLAPTTHVVPHAMVDDPVFAAVRASGEASVAHAVSLFRRVLVEDAALVVLLPVSWVHWVLTNEFELAEAVVAIVATSGGVDDEFLACLGVRKLLRAFVRCEAVVFTATVRSLFPGVFWHAAEAHVSIRNNPTDRNLKLT